MRYAAVLLLLILAGCGPSFADRFEAVEPGASMDTVTESLGPPDGRYVEAYTLYQLGPPEILQGLVVEGDTIHTLEWVRPARPDTVVYVVYLTPSGRVIQTTTYTNSMAF